MEPSPLAAKLVPYKPVAEAPKVPLPSWDAPLLTDVPSVEPIPVPVRITLA